MDGGAVADVIGDFIARLQARLGPDVSFSVTELEREIRDEWGGRWVYLSQRSANARRDDMIRVLFRGGTSVKTIASRYGLSERQVWRIANRK